MQPTPAARRKPNQAREQRNDHHAHSTARPGGSTGTSRARCCVRLVAVTPQRARAPPYRLPGRPTVGLTCTTETDITYLIQRRRQHPRHTGRDRSEQMVAIRRNYRSRSPECAVRRRGDINQRSVQVEKDSTSGRVIKQHHRRIPLALGHRFGAAARAGPGGRAFRYQWR
jgi:hypothetical protein